MSDEELTYEEYQEYVDYFHEYIDEVITSASNSSKMQDQRSTHALQPHSRNQLPESS